MKDSVKYGKYCCMREICTDATPDVIKYPVRINAFVLVVCSNGLLDITYNLTHFTLSANSLFLYQPGAILRLNALEPSRLNVMVFTREFVDSLGVKFDNIPLQYKIVRERNTFALSEKACCDLRLSLDLAGKSIMLDSSKSYYDEMVRTSFKAFFYRALYEINDIYGDESACELPLSQENSHFDRFMRLLEANYKEQHNIKFYSGKMGLTPKYLSLMIKKVSGKLATEWIDDYVVLEAKNLIKYSSMSIQEIAYALNFPNQSFFGKYFKRHTGLSPKAYRQQQ